MPERNRGLLVKIRVNRGKCKDCFKIYLTHIQASKVGARSGWYESMIQARSAIEADPGLDPAIRISGKKRCPTCPNL